MTPSGHITFIQCIINVDVTSTLLQRCQRSVSAGPSERQCPPDKARVKEKNSRRYHERISSRWFCGIFPDLFLKAYTVGTNLNCLDKSRQFN